MAELEHTDQVDTDLKSLLGELDTDIHRLLKETDPEDDAPGIADRARRVAARFESDHPTAARLLTELAETLGKMGI